MQSTDLPTVIVTGASSGVGLHAAKSPSDRGWFVVMACRDLNKAATAARPIGMHADRQAILELDLASQDGVYALVAPFHALGRPLHVRLRDAAVYLPRLKAPRRSPEGDEISVATNHFGHFLLSRLLLDDLKRAPATGSKARLITLGTVTDNSEELGGKVPIPAPANLGERKALEAGLQARVAMIDGKSFKPGKACKDSKLCNRIISREVHRRHREESGAVFGTLDPGCVADTALVRDTPKAFQTIFRWFQNNITKVCGTQALAGQRVAQVVVDEAFARSGVHWSWGNRQQEGRQAFAQPPSAKASDAARASRLWSSSERAVGLA